VERIERALRVNDRTSIFYTCLPDTVDPREPKGKCRNCSLHPPVDRIRRRRCGGRRSQTNCVAAWVGRRYSGQPGPSDGRGSDGKVEREPDGRSRSVSRLQAPWLAL
jgi:hypothetical protein